MYIGCVDVNTIALFLFLSALLSLLCTLLYDRNRCCCRKVLITTLWRPSLLARYLANRCQYTARAYVLPNLPRADTSSGWHSGWRRIGSREARLSRSHATSDKGCRAGLASARLSTSLRECKLTKRELVSSCKQSPRSACSGSRELRGGRVERVPGFVWEQGV